MRIPIIIPMKGRGLINQVSGAGVAFLWLAVWGLGFGLENWKRICQLLHFWGHAGLNTIRMNSYKRVLPRRICQDILLHNVEKGSFPCIKGSLCICQYIDIYIYTYI